MSEGMQAEWGSAQPQAEDLLARMLARSQPYLLQLRLLWGAVDSADPTHDALHFLRNAMKQQLGRC